MAATGTPTPNLGLRIPVGTDPASVDDINYNSNVLDTKIGAIGNSSVKAQLDALNDQFASRIGSADGITWMKAWDANKYYRLQMNDDDHVYVLSSSSPDSNYSVVHNISSACIKAKRINIGTSGSTSITITVGSKYWSAFAVGMINNVGPFAVLLYNSGSTSPSIVDLSGGALATGKNALSIEQPTNTSVTVSISSQTFREITIYQ